MKIAIIGGGGTRTPILSKGLMELEEDLKIEEVSFFDIDRERLSLISRVLEGIRPPDSRVRFSFPEDLREALKGSSFVFLTLRVGKEEMRVLDERIPLSLGIIGQETVGAGGGALAVRTVPKVLEIARLIKEECPSAWAINFTNPSGIVTQALLDHSLLERVVGICDGPSTIKAFLSRFFEVPEEDIFLDYFGLNHLGWVKGIFVRGEDFLPKLMKYLPMVSEMENVVQFPLDFLQKLKMVPSPYLRYYYFPEKALKEMLNESKTRGEKVLEMNHALFSALREGKGNPVEIYEKYIKQRESQYGQIKEGFNLEEGEGYIKVALEVLRGLTGFRVGTPVVNLKNRSAILGMEEDDVVEVPVHLLSGFVRPISCGRVPQECLDLMKKVKLFEKTLVRAIVEKSREGIIKAMSLNPLVGSKEIAGKLYEEFSRHQAPFWP